MIVGMHPQHFLRYQFQRQQQFSTVSQQKVHVRAREFNHQVGILEFGVRIIPGFNREPEIEAPACEYRSKIFFDFGTGAGN